MVTVGNFFSIVFLSLFFSTASAENLHVCIYKPIKLCIFVHPYVPIWAKYLNVGIMNLFNYVCTYMSICDLEKKIFYLAILEKASIIQLYCCVSLFMAIYKFRFLFFRSKYTCLKGFSCCFPHTGSSECYPTCFYHPNSVLSKAVQRAVEPFG